MTKKELVAYVAEKANLSKKDAEIAVNSVFDGITEALKTDGKIQLVGLRNQAVFFYANYRRSL